MMSDVCLTSVGLDVAYIGDNSRIERPSKTKIGTQVAHVTRDSDTTFNVNRSKVNLQGRGNIVADPRTSLIFSNSLISMEPTAIASKARWAPGAAGVRDGLPLGRSDRRTAGGGILCRHAQSLLLKSGDAL